jgi:hypothetical protein
VWAKLLINGVRIVKKQGLTPQMQKVRQRRVFGPSLALRASIEITVKPQAALS